ncbi:hypothetical protein RJZ90_007042 [Blastomyces dermatitidis]
MTKAIGLSFRASMGWSCQMSSLGKISLSFRASMGWSCQMSSLGEISPILQSINGLVMPNVISRGNIPYPSEHQFQELESASAELKDFIQKSASSDTLLQVRFYKIFTTAE